jgi:hypothetical protein
VVGPDGVGKTDFARALLTGWCGPTGYVHFRPRLFQGLPPFPPTAAPTLPKAEGRFSTAVSISRLLASWIRFWVGYLLLIRPAVMRGALVVADRWGYGYIVQPAALRYSGPQSLAALVVRRLPRPDLVFNLRATAPLIRARKQELEIPRILQELDDWAALRAFAPVVNIDNEGPLGDTVATARAVLERGWPVSRLHFSLPLWLPSESRTAARAGLALWPATTRRAMLARRITDLGLLVVPSLLGSKEYWQAEMPAWNGILTRLQQEFGPLGFVAVSRPRQASRLGIRLLLLTPSGTPFAFMKARPGFDRDLIREHEALSLIAGSGANNSAAPCNVPEVLHFESNECETVLVSTARSGGWDSPPLEPNLPSLGAWIGSALRGLPRPKDVPDRWEPLHGDLTPWNLRQTRTGLWLVDWEMAGWAPPGADEICYAANCLAVGRSAPGFRFRAEAADFWEEIWTLRLTQVRSATDRKLGINLISALRELRYRYA